jgi:peptidylprolyl isomerase
MARATRVTGFRDEISDLHFDKGGILAMANSGPGTNSSQFFITHLETPWLEGRHTIFGHVVAHGMETVNKIAQDDVIKMSQSLGMVRPPKNSML